MRRFLSCSTLALALFLPTAASALQLPLGAASTDGPSPESGALVAPPGAPRLRHEVSVRYGAPPPPLAAAWGAFVADTGGRPWTALWDTATGRPLRLFGSFVPAPGASANPAAAAKHARALLARHADLLLAGVPAADFDLVTDDDDAGLRTVGFQQMVHVGDARVPLVGGRVNVRFKADRLFVLGSEALPVASFPPPQRTSQEAETAALVYLAPSQPLASVVSATLVALPLVHAASGAAPSAATSPRAAGVRVVPVWQILTESASPASRTEVFVDARSGDVVATREGLRFLTGSLHYKAPTRGPQAHSDFPARGAHFLVDNSQFSVDEAGQYTVDPAAATLSCFAASDVIHVFNAAGDPASLAFTPQDGGDVVWSLADDEQGDAQLSGFVHASIAKATAREIDPTMKFLDDTLQVRVNQQDDNYICNAFWNGVTLNFFVKYQICNNTARVADVIYHEFGHAFHTHTALPSVGDYDPALAEGGADYFATIVTSDPLIAPGFYTNDTYLREIDSDRRWPDEISWDPHETGLIFAGAMWDLRALLEQEMGPDAGPPLAHALYRAALRRAQNIPATYAEILAADDDDGDLGNGTPHICEILAAFVPHGLSPYVTPSGGILVHEPVRNLPGQSTAYDFTAKVTETFPQCAGAGGVGSIDLHWRTLGASGDVTLEKDAEGAFTGKVPGQLTGTQLRYSLTVKGTGGKAHFPQNIADSEYRAFVGDVTPLYCSDFEQGAGDWTLGEIGGKAADFVWGSPNGAGGDPEAAYSGQYVIGTMLQNDGLYRKHRTSFAEGPVVDLGEHKHVRLQLMRWLTVEDGYFDQARILLNGQPVWANAGTDQNDGTYTHQDLEWRFEDIDLSNFTAGGNHTAQVRFELASDGLTQLGGWNLDDVCIVAWEPPPPSTGAGGAGGAEGGAGGGGGAGPAEDTPNTSCACRTTPSQDSGPWAFAGVAAALLGLARRRRRGTPR